MTQISISGHKEGIAGVTWMESATEVITCSWDHTIRIWDAEMATLKTELVGILGDVKDKSRLINVISFFQN